MGDQDCSPDFEYSIVRTISGVIMGAPGVLYDAFVTPLTCMFRGVWSIAGTPITFYLSMYFFILGDRAWERRRRIRYYCQGAALIVFHAFYLYLWK